MEPLIGLDFKDFQSLADTKLTLDPGLNVIVGPSNLGKSAAIRGLKALVYNAPVTGLVRDKAKQFEVKAWFRDGQSIELIKGKNKSEYYWNDNLYAKSGANEAPETVQKHWQVATPDGRQLCFASQHDTPFLLAEPASAASKVLGDLTNASKLMEAVSEANKLRTQALSDAKARTREAEEAREEILTHAGLSARGKALRAARERFSVAQSSAAKWLQLVQLSEAFTNIERQQKMNAQILDQAVSIDGLVAKLDEAIAVLTQLTQLEQTYVGVRNKKHATDNEIQYFEEELKFFEKQIHQLLEDAGVCPLCGNETK